MSFSMLSATALARAQASGTLLPDFLEKIVCRGEYLVIQIDRIHECLHCESDSRIVVDDEDRGGLFCLSCHGP